MQPYGKASYSQCAAGCTLQYPYSGNTFQLTLERTTRPLMLLSSAYTIWAYSCHSSYSIQQLMTAVQELKH